MHILLTSEADVIGFRYFELIFIDNRENREDFAFLVAFSTLSVSESLSFKYIPRCFACLVWEMFSDPSLNVNVGCKRL